MNAPFTPAPAPAFAPEMSAMYALQEAILGLIEADPELNALAQKCPSWENVKAGMTPVIDLLPEMGDIAIAADVAHRGF